MASTINATTASGGGVITTADASGVLQLQTGGTTGVELDASQLLKFNSGYGSVATAYGCRAWVNFNGTGTVAIRASGNVTSITDNGTGDYTVNFTNAFPDVNYAATAIVGGTAAATVMRTYEDGTARSTTALRFSAFVSTNGAPGDWAQINIAFFR